MSSTNKGNYTQCFNCIYKKLEGRYPCIFSHKDIRTACGIVQERDFYGCGNFKKENESRIEIIKNDSNYIKGLQGALARMDNREALIHFDNGEKCWVPLNAYKEVKDVLEDISVDILEDIDNCGLTRIKCYNFISKQIYNTIESIDDKIIIANYTELKEELLGFLILNKEFTDNNFDYYKTLIHLSSSCIDKMSDHGYDYDPDNINGFLFSYFYSILDTLVEYEEWGYKLSSS